ncbi:S26 family signal peptidase [Micromonospora sp. NPDC047738]
MPYGRVVVLGDNPRRSLDSRQSGYVTTDRLLGVVLRRLR